MSRFTSFACTLLLSLAACSEPAQKLPPFLHDPAVSGALAQLESQIAEQEAKPAPAEQTLEAEQIGGLVHILANSTGRTRALPLEEIRIVGEAAIAPLVVIAARSDQNAAERLAAIELLAEVGGPRATEHLLQMCEKAPEDWIRRQAAWRLGSIGSDWVVPRLILRLKYELDHETALWIADTLAQYGNYSGQVALWNIRRNGNTEALRLAADEHLVSSAERAGARDADHLWELWFVADPDDLLLRADVSARLQREVWKRISSLSGEHFQLRGVDDGRFVLSQMGAWVTEPLSRALHDEDVYVRVHASQCLERMGPRAVRAGPTLVQGLGDPTLAPAAAAALGVIAYPSAEPVLRRLLLDAGTDYELRVACATALGRIGLSASLAALEQVLSSEDPFDLRQRAAIALCELGSGAGEQGASFLLDALDDVRADRFGAEVALGKWLASLESIAAQEVRDAWDALATAQTGSTSSADAEARIAARGKLLRERLPELLAQ